MEQLTHEVTEFIGRRLTIDGIRIAKGAKLTTRQAQLLEEHAKLKGRKVTVERLGSSKPTPRPSGPSGS